MPRPSQRLSHNRLAPARLARALSLCSLLLVPALAHAQQTVAPAPNAAKAGRPDTLFTGATSLYDDAIKTRVSEAGFLDYAKLKGDANLEAFVAALPSVDTTKFPAFEVKATPEDDARTGRRANKNDKKGPTVDRSWELAFWINAHNALAIKTLADAYPIGSPDDVKDFATRKHSVAGGQYTLGEIRARAGQIDRRAPLAMIDGTQGGPKMAPRAMRAYGLNDTLESAVTALVNDPRLVQLQRIDNRVSVAPFLASVDEAWKPRTATRKLDGVRYLLSAYAAAGPDRNYYTTNRYEVLLGQGIRKLNVVPSAFGGG